MTQILLTEEPYSELFYDTQDAKVIKKTQDNVKNTLTDNIKLPKTNAIITVADTGRYLYI